jgi:hypothetical protein
VLKNALKSLIYAIVMEHTKTILKEQMDWTTKFTNEVAIEYEKFMHLKTLDDDISPCANIDIMWHEMILDTKTYNDYCLKNHGQLIHHYPQNAVDDDKRNLRFKKTLILYSKTYNANPPNNVWELYQCMTCDNIKDKSFFNPSTCCNIIFCCKRCDVNVTVCPGCEIALAGITMNAPKKVKVKVKAPSKVRAPSKSINRRPKC